MTDSLKDFISEKVFGKRKFIKLPKRKDDSVINEEEDVTELTQVKEKSNITLSLEDTKKMLDQTIKHNTEGSGECG